MIAVCGCSKQTTTCGELPKVINTDHHQKPACAGCIGLRLRPRPHAVVEHSKSRRPQLPRVGAFFLDTDAKKSLHGRGWRFQCREAGDLQRHGSISRIGIEAAARWLRSRRSRATCRSHHAARSEPRHPPFGFECRPRSRSHAPNHRALMLKAMADRDHDALEPARDQCPADSLR
jgi:hypothetical protein